MTLQGYAIGPREGGHLVLRGGDIVINADPERGRRVVGHDLDAKLSASSKPSSQQAGVRPGFDDRRYYIACN